MATLPTKHLIWASTYWMYGKGIFENTFCNIYFEEKKKIPVSILCDVLEKWHWARLIGTHVPA